MDSVIRKSVPLDEQETSISIVPDDDQAIVYSSVPTTVRRLYKYAEEHPDECKITNDDGYGCVCSMPVDWIRYQPRKKREMTEEQKAVAAARLRSAREAKKNQ